MEGKKSLVDLECYSLQRAGFKVLIIKAVVKLTMGSFQVVLLCHDNHCRSFIRWLYYIVRISLQTLF